jgi:acylglycerol lipase
MLPMQTFKKLIDKSSAFSFAAIIAISSNLMLSGSASAEVVRDDYPQLRGLHDLPQLPVSVWRDSQSKPRAAAIAVHGLAMHGRVYDRLASELVAQGVQVYAEDLRGYGRWQCQGELDAAEARAAARTVNYKDSLEDLKVLIKAVRAEHPGLPLFLIGESMGAGFSMRAAEAMPDEVDGLILASPALKRRNYVGPELVKDMAALVANPTRELDLVPYIKKLASENDKIVEEAINDPYVRKSLNCKDLLQTAHCISTNMEHAKGVSEHVPVLIIQGDQDKLLKHAAVVALVNKLKSKDQTVRWMKGKGHLLIETSYIDPSTMSTIKTWLASHVNDSAQVATGNPLNLNLNQNLGGALRGNGDNENQVSATRLD